MLNPETIGSLAYLSLRGEKLRRNLVAGYALSFAGTDAPLRYKRSRRHNSLADIAAVETLKARTEQPPTITNFDPFGGDERQYCAPGFNLPVGVISRTSSDYAEYHSSFDNRDFISFEAMAQTVDAYEAVCEALDSGRHEAAAAQAATPEPTSPRGPRYLNLLPDGEPQLGKRGLYPTLGRTTELEQRMKALFWMLNLADGRHGLDDIAQRSGLPKSELQGVADDFVAAGLMERLGG